VSDDRELSEQVARLETQVADLRRDVARLWLAYGRHEGLGAAKLEASGGSGAAGEQLAELSEVLAAIERATDALEGAYEDGAGADEQGGESERRA
jgi:hypothetical protein